MILRRKMWLDEKGKTITFIIVLAALAVIHVAFWPSMKRLIPMMMQEMPEFVRNMFAPIAEEGFSFYIISQMVIKVVGIFGSALAIMLGASAISREREAGTLVLLMAQPISRNRVLLEKYFFNALMLAVPLIFSVLLVYPAGLVIGEYLEPLNVILLSLYSSLVMLSIYSLTFALGVFVDEQMRTVSISLGICVVMTIMSIFKETNFLSIYTWIGPEVLRPLLSAGVFPVVECISCVVLSMLFLLVAWVRFRKLTI